MFFIDVPGAARSSFRKASKIYYGESKVSFDYGLNSAETSDDVLELIHKRNDFFSFHQEFKEQRKIFFCADANLWKYMSFFGLNYSATFVGEPYARLASEFLYYSMHYRYRGDFLSFIENPKFINLQSRCLNLWDISAYGFVGLTERYQESLSMLNAKFQVDIPEIELHEAQDISAMSRVGSATLKERVKELNGLDYALYERAEKSFQIRRDLLIRGEEFAHGFVQELRPGEVRGWAWWDRSDSPVEIEVVVKGGGGECNADMFVPSLAAYRAPRNGFVGFRVKFSPEIRSEEEVQCRVKRTGQVLFRQGQCC